MSSFQCTSCAFVAPTRYTLIYHESVTHVNECVLSKGSRHITVKRRKGKFTCKCGSSTTSSRKFYSHLRCYFPKQQTPRPDSSSSQADAQSCTSAVSVPPASVSCSATTIPQGEELAPVASCVDQPISMTPAAIESDSSSLTADSDLSSQVPVCICTCMYYYCSRGFTYVQPNHPCG